MADRAGIFAGEDPFDLLRDWMQAAAESEPADPSAASLATVDADGMPNVRIVLLKEIEADGLVFYTNYESRKGRELDAAAVAAIAIHWKSLGRQVRARGAVERTAAAQSDAYFHSRPLASRIGAWASQQSRPLECRARLEQQLLAVQAAHGDDPPRPPHWGGYRLCPISFEFWADGPGRLHDRFHWQRAARGAEWIVERLNP